ncbi:hypothetical protein [Cellulomonas fengjieae]|uniref:Uncharacterized protein n=1 Tax=Cellulomonas fengjieae TaxID=2819978 RepID=A0ABS3SLL4_9CELL|nr:hypothetical protein [Cellulomonas fengjieae]MBO3086617.1 hypothetical protein [Cellulomonas fengjieae]QVI66534.1 hypothetical protein KG102_02695 [Cellulomonas fengjieae]
MQPAMAFGDDDDLDQRFRFTAPDNEAPAAVGVSGVIGRSADAAVLLAGLSRYTVGLQIDLAIRRRLDPDPTDPMHSTLGAGLLVGVELADGRTVVAGHPPWPPADGPVLVYRGGGGGGREWSSTLWLTPAPPPGDLVVVVACPSLGVDESRVVVAAEALRAAADRTEILWPREPDQAHPGIEPRPPDVPPGGWFEQALAATTD